MNSLYVGLQEKCWWNCNHQHLPRVRQVCFTWEGKSLAMEKIFSGRFNLSMSNDQETGTGWCPTMPDYFSLVNCLAQPKVGQRDGKASTHQLSNIWHAVRPQTKWYLTHWSSLTWTMAFPYKGHPEHTSDHISAYTLTLPSFYMPSCTPSPPHTSTKGISHRLPDHMKQNIHPLRECMNFTRGSFTLKKTKFLTKDVANQDRGTDVCWGDMAG